jgi:hypothetical protein
MVALAAVRRALRGKPPVPPDAQAQIGCGVIGDDALSALHAVREGSRSARE